MIPVTLDRKTERLYFVLEQTSCSIGDDYSRSYLFVKSRLVLLSFHCVCVCVCVSVRECTDYSSVSRSIGQFSCYTTTCFFKYVDHVTLNFIVIER